MTEIKVTRVPLDSNGYDKRGGYWGVDEPLFRIAWYESDGSTRYTYRRARNYQWLRRNLKDYVKSNGKVLP